MYNKEIGKHLNSSKYWIRLLINVLIRTKNKTYSNEKDDIQVCLSVKTKFQLFLKEANSNYSKVSISQKLTEVNEQL